MTKSQLIADLAASNPHLRQGDIELIVEAVFGQIAESGANQPVIPIHSSH